MKFEEMFKAKQLGTSDFVGNEFLLQFEEILKICDVYFIVGNHEMSDSNGYFYSNSIFSNSLKALSICSWYALKSIPFINL